MTRRIDQAFKNAKNTGRKVLIPYIMAGDPDLATTRKLVPALAAAGADVIELGIPFSDPIADGPVILKAAGRALALDTALTDVLQLVRELRADGVTVPIVFMSYYNPIYKFGDAAFARAAADAGVDGVIVPDLPPEEAHDLVAACRAHKIATVFLLAPTSDATRIAKVTRQATGFIYYVSLTGITGAKLSDPGDVKAKLAPVRAATNKPIAVGFGISTPEQAAKIGALADGVIVGSALVKVIATTAEAGGDSDQVVAAASAFTKALREGLDG